MRVLSLFGRLVLTVAMMALITSASLFVLGAYLATWPIMRQSPRTRRKRATMEAALALAGLAQAFAPSDPENSRPNPPNPAPSAPTSEGVDS